MNLEVFKFQFFKIIVDNIEFYLCPQISAFGAGTSRHFNKGYVCMFPYLASATLGISYNEELNFSQSLFTSLHKSLY